MVYSCCGLHLHTKAAQLHAAGSCRHSCHKLSQRSQQLKALNCALRGSQDAKDSQAACFCCELINSRGMGLAGELRYAAVFVTELVERVV